MGLELSPKKTEILIFKKGYVQPEKISLHIGSIRVENRQQAKFLGVTIDQKLTFVNYIQNLNVMC